MNPDPFFWKGRSVLITGATGLLGGWLTPALIRKGANVVALVRELAPDRMLVRDGWLDRLTAIRGCLGDDVLIRRTLAEYSVQTVFHLGGQTLVGVANANPVGTLEANVRGTYLLLEAARHTRVEQILIASSVKAYGTSGLQPHREDDPLQGRFPYDVSKACMDLIASMYAHSFGVPAAIVRCGNLYGGGDLNFSRLIPGLIRATLNDERFSIRSDGKCVRDFLYVEDAAEAYLWLAEAMALDHSLHGEAFNFGLELRCTMIEVTERILSLMGRSDLIPIVKNMAIGETREQILDVTKARVRLKWSPRYGMDEGLKLTIDWYSKFLRLANHRPVVLGNASRESEVPKSQTEASAYL